MLSMLSHHEFDLQETANSGRLSVDVFVIFGMNYPLSDHFSDVKERRRRGGRRGGRGRRGPGFGHS